MTNRHIRKEYPAKQIQLEPLPLIYCRSILLFSFFFPSELEINNSAGNHSVVVANSLTSHPIFFLSVFLPLSSSLLSSLCLIFSSFPFCFICFHACACSVCMYISWKLSVCLCEWWFTSSLHTFCPFIHSSFPSLFFLSFILPSPLLSSFFRSRAWWQSHDLHRWPGISTGVPDTGEQCSALLQCGPGTHFGAPPHRQRGPKPGGPHQPPQGWHGAQERCLYGSPEEQVSTAAAAAASAPQPTPQSAITLTLPCQHEGHIRAVCKRTGTHFVLINTDTIIIRCKRWEVTHTYMHITTGVCVGKKMNELSVMKWQRCTSRERGISKTRKDGGSAVEARWSPWLP